MSGWNDLLGQLTTIYALPSIFALATKILIFYLARSSIKQTNRWLCAILLGFFGLNTCEMASFLLLDQPGQALPLLMFYYLFCVVTSLALVGMALKLGGYSSVTGNYVLGCILLIGTVAVFTPGAAFSGVQSLGYVLARIPGPYYWVVQLIAVGSLLVTAALLTYNSIQSDTRIKRVRSGVFLLAASPVIITSVITMVAMHKGAQFNAAIILPISINIFLAVILYADKKQRLFNLLSVIPNTAEHKKIKLVKNLIHEPGKMDLKSSRQKFEELLVASALEHCEGNKKAAAQLLGISRTQIYKKLPEQQNS